MAGTANDSCEHPYVGCYVAVKYQSSECREDCLKLGLRDSKQPDTKGMSYVESGYLGRGIVTFYWSPKGKVEVAPPAPPPAAPVITAAPSSNTTKLESELSAITKRLKKAQAESDSDRQKMNQTLTALNQQLKDSKEKDEKRYLEMTEKHKADMKKLLDELNEAKRVAKTPEEYATASKKGFQVLLGIAAKLEPCNLASYPSSCRHVAFFGSTSVGKSTLINTILEEKVAKTGKGETTVSVAPYPAKFAPFVLWDFPGKNDEVSYFSTETLSLAKAMELCCVLFVATVKDCTAYIQLLESMGKDFVCVLTQCDDDEWNDKEIEHVKSQTVEFVGKMKGYKGFYAISAKNPTLRDTRALFKEVSGAKKEKS